MCLTARASEGSEHTSLSLVTRGGEWERGGGFAQHTTHLHPSAPLYLHHWHSGEHTCLLLALSTHEGDNSFTIHLFPHLCAQCTQVCKSVQKRTKAYKSAKAWTAHVKEPKVAPFFPLGKSLSSPVFGRKVQNPFF